MILLSMIFLHIIDDFYLQPGLLSKLKQKDWWVENVPQKLYRYDYLWALLVHSFSWAFMMMLPIMYIMDFKLEAMFYTVFGANILIHLLIDDLKANRKKINLIEDQLIHIVQIIATYMILN